MSLLTFSQEGMETLWTHTVKNSLRHARKVLHFEIRLESLSGKCFTILTNLTVSRVRVLNVIGQMTLI